MKKAITGFTLAMVLMVSTAFAGDGILVAGRDGILISDKGTCSQNAKDGIIIGDFSDGILVAGLTGILVAGFTGILVGDKTNPCTTGKDGILVAGRDGILISD